MYFHICSSNEQPLHSMCPKGADSWCKFQRAVVTKTEYDHNSHFHLSEIIMLEVKPIFPDLAHSSLLKKCLHGKNQNPNESVNNITWSRLPKGTFGHSGRSKRCRGRGGRNDSSKNIGPSWPCRLIGNTQNNGYNTCVTRVTK